MDKQRPVNKVVHNDAYSASLMEMYTNWMAGDCFQGSNIPEAFNGMDPQSHGAEVEDTTKKKKKIDKKEKSVAEEVVLEREEIEIDGETIIIEKKKGLDGKACWKGYKLAGTKKKGGKTVDNCVKAGDEVSHDGEELAEKKGLYANIHAKRKRGEKPAKPGDKDYPKTLNVERYSWRNELGIES